VAYLRTNLTTLAVLAKNVRWREVTAILGRYFDFSVKVFDRKIDDKKLARHFFVTNFFVVKETFAELLSRSERLQSTRMPSRFVVATTIPRTSNIEKDRTRC